MKHHHNWLIVAIMCALAAGCSDPQGDWETARQADTREAYDAFLAEHPQGEYADQARSRIEEMEREAAWDTAQREGTSEAFGAFLNQYPEGPHSQEATERRAQLEREAEWEQLQTRDDLEAEDLSEFVSRYPASSEATEARRMINALETEAAAQPADAEEESFIEQAAPSTPSPTAAPGAEPTAAPGAEPSVAPAAAPAGDFGVQLGAFRAEDSANQERDRLQEAHGDLLGEVTVEGPEAGSSFYRLRSGAMTREAARDTCAKLEEQDQPCIVVDR